MGEYISYNETKMSDELRKEWDKWLNDNFDPGHYDTDKDEYGKHHGVTYIPEYLYVKLLKEQNA